ncbi:MAG: EF-hand domain-containing protein [Ottowia sp.]
MPRHLLPLALALLLTAAQPAAAQTPPAAAQAEPQPAKTEPAEAAKPPSKGEKQANAWFDMLDTNHDNKLEWSEVRWVPWGPLRDEFHTADTDGDGYLTREEIRVLAKRRVQERRERKAREAAEKQAREAARQQQPASGQ